MLLAICHSSVSGWTKVDDLSKLSDIRAEAGNILWAEADVADLDLEDVRTIAEEFGLHPLAVEDAMSTRQRPKSETYSSHQFVVFHQLDEEDDHLEARQIACFLGEGYVLTIHGGAGRTIEAAKERWRSSDLSHSEPSVLLHTLIDVVVDEYQVFADRLESDVEELEEISLATPDAQMQHQLYALKQGIARMRRYVLPAGRMLDWTMRHDQQLVSSATTKELFRDVADHLTRIAEQIHNVDELTQAVMDFTRSEQAHRLNEINRRLSAWAAIFAIQTVIAGIYGMNFELLPNENSLEGFLFALGLMLVISVTLFAYFRRKGWL